MDALLRLPYIYDVATSDRNWTSALDHMSDVIGSKGSAIFAANNGAFDFSLVSTNSLFVGKDTAVAEYFTRFREIDEYAVNFAFNSRPFERVVDEDFWPGFMNLQTRDDLKFMLENFGVFRRAAYNISEQRAWNAFIVFHYESSVRNFRKNWLGDTNALIRHLSKALEINRFYSQLRKRYDAVLTVLDKIDAALCILLPTGEVIVRNKKAQKIFEDRNGILLTRENHLSLRDQNQTEKLRSFAMKCCETAAGRNSQSERIVKAAKNSIGDSYLIEISPLRDGDDELNENLSGAMMTIIDPQDSPKLAIEAAAQLYDLTTAEAAVSGLLIEGKTLPEIADIGECP